MSGKEGEEGEEGKEGELFVAWLDGRRWHALCDEGGK